MLSPHEVCHPPLSWQLCHPPPRQPSVLYNLPFHDTVTPTVSPLLFGATCHPIKYVPPPSANLTHDIVPWAGAGRVQYIFGSPGPPPDGYLRPPLVGPGVKKKPGASALHPGPPPAEARAPRDVLHLPRQRPGQLASRSHHRFGSVDGLVLW